MCSPRPLRNPRPMPESSRLVRLLDSGVIAGAAVCGLAALYFAAQIASFVWR